MILSVFRSSARHLIGTLPALLASPKLLLGAVAVGSAVMVYGKYSSMRVDTAELRADFAVQESDLLRQRTQQLNSALYLLQHHESQRVERDQRNQFALESLRREEDYALDLDVSAGVMRILRPPIRADPDATADTP